MRFATKAIHSGQAPIPPYNSAVTPIYQASTYIWDNIENVPEHMYSRESNPTVSALETCMADLENARHCFAFASGLAAEHAALSILKPGDRILGAKDIYGGTYHLCKSVLEPNGVIADFVDFQNLDLVESELRKRTKLVWFETPANPLLTILDIQSLAALAHRYNAISVVDNTFATPYYQNPLDLGVDVVTHSATKYIGGHTDLLGGFVALNDDEIANQIMKFRNVTGAISAPFDSWLMLRGLKTLKVRMREHSSNALQVARLLEESKGVERVFFPGLETHQGHLIAYGQMRGWSGMLSFVLEGGKPAATKFLNNLKVIAIGASLGGVESLASYPPLMSHSLMSVEERQKIGVVDGLVRLSVGIEDIEDILEDISQALEVI